MLIRHKLILWFIILVSLILLAFSTYVYYSFTSFRDQSIEVQLERRAQSTRQLLTQDGEVVGSINPILPEQVDFVFSSTDSLVYTNSTQYDFYPSAAFLDSVRKERRIHFTYASADHKYPKDAVAVAYKAPRAKGAQPLKDQKDYVALVVAYDREGYQRQESLLDLFIYGNFLAIAIVGAMAYFFAVRSLQPLNGLIRQIRERYSTSISFRLKSDNPKDEIGTLAQSFNELLEQQEHLMANQRAFISQASHELRTPIATLKGVLETSLLYDTDTDSLKKSMEKAVSELDRLISLSNGLLQLARIENDEDYIHTHQVDLMELTLDSVDFVQSNWPSQSISLEISDGVLQQTRPLLISGESTLLKIALCNLIDNACKYSAGRPVKVLLEMNTEDMIRFSVLDQGIGIPAKDLDLIFLPLVRGSNVETTTGFGIGLTLAQKIIKLHHGELRMNSTVGKGTSIRIDFPFGF